MSKKVTELLTKAKALNSQDLADGIEALEFLGGDATANNMEYKQLKELVELVEAGAGDGSGEDEPVALQEGLDEEKAKQDAKDKADADAKAKQDAAAGKNDPKPDEKPPEEPTQTKPRKNYAGIKMVGSQYFWTGDYSKGFSNADDCADYRDEKQGK